MSPQSSTRVLYTFVLVYGPENHLPALPSDHRRPIGTRARNSAICDANRVVKLDGVRLRPFLHPLQHTTTLLSDKMAALSTSAFTGKALVAKAQIRAKASKASVVVKASASDNKSKVSFRD